MTENRWTARAGPAVLATLAPLTLLAVDPAGWYPFGPVKWLAVSVLGCLGVGLVLASRPVSVPAPLGWALVALVGWMAVAATVGDDPTYTWIGTPERHLGVVTWALCAALLVVGAALPRAGSAVPPPFLLPGLVVAGVGVGLVASAEAAGWEPAVLDVGRRLTGSLGSAAYLGAATALLLPLAVGVALDTGLPRRLRLPAVGAVPLLAVACLGSGARAAWLGLAVAALAVAWARRSWLAAHRRIVSAAGVAGAVAVLALVLLTPVGGRLSSVSDPDAPGGRGRLDEWRVATNVLFDHPVTGVGPEGYRIAFHEGVDAAYERAHGRDQQPDRAHSGPLDVALAGGLPALAAWAAVVVLAGMAAARALRRGRLWQVGIAAGLVAHLAGQLLLFPLAELEPVAWLLAGVLVATAPRRAPAARLVPRAIPVGLVALAGLALVAGVTDVVADRRADTAAAALQRGDHRAAARAAVDAVRLRPDIVRLHMLAAVARVADEQGTLEGIRQLDRALTVSPGDPIVRRARVTLLVDRAAATQVPAHLEAARAELDRLLAADTHNARLWAQAERLAHLEGDRGGAAEARRRWEDLVPPERRPGEEVEP